RLAALAKKFPQTKISCLVDDLSIVSALSAAAVAAGVTITAFLDVNVGMNRTGIVIGPAAKQVYAALSKAPGLHAGGLHAYDGHLHDSNHDKLVRDIEAAFVPFWKFHADLVASGLPVPLVIAGGTPSSPI